MDTKEDAAAVAVVAEEAVVVVTAEVRVGVAAVEVADVEISTPDTSQSEICSTPNCHLYKPVRGDPKTER